MNVLEYLDYLIELNEKYNLKTDEIKNEMVNYKNQKLSVPILGRFSSGKTALINALLGYNEKLLKEDVTPETSIPAEILYGENEEEINVVYSDYTKKVMKKDLKTFDFNYSEISKVQYKLDNENLKSIRDVMLVDMPGFDSGCEVHNKAIDEYLPNSLAYIFVFSSEEMTLKENMKNVLKELVLNDMDICIVITKSDKVIEEILLANMEKLKSDFKKYITRKDIEFCVTSSSEKKIDEFKNYLFTLQENSQDIILKKYKKIVVKFISGTEIYLKALIENQNLTLSALSEKEENIKAEMKQLHENLKEESRNFEESIPICVQEVKADLLNALNNDVNTLATILSNNQSIDERVNSLVRISITKSINERFLPKVKKHMDNVSNNIKTFSLVEPLKITENINSDIGDIGKNITRSIIAILSLVKINPIIAAIAGLIAFFTGSSGKEQRGEDKKAQINQKLRSEIFPNILKQVEEQMSVELKRKEREISKQVTMEIDVQYDTLSKALKQVIEKKDLEEKQKENFLKEVNSDLEKLRGIKDECK